MGFYTPEFLLKITLWDWEVTRRLILIHYWALSLLNTFLHKSTRTLLQHFIC